MGENNWYISDVKVENIISDKDSDLYQTGIKVDYTENGIEKNRITVGINITSINERLQDKGILTTTLTNNTTKDTINLFFDVTKNGLTTNNTNLSIFSNGKIEDIINNPYGITIDNYFTSGKDISSKAYTGDGCIENIQDSTEKLDIDTAIQEISSKVAEWLDGKADSAYSIMMGTDIETKKELLNLYMSYDIQYI